MVFAIVGITGNVGGYTAEFLLQEGKKVRAVVRDEKKAEAWKNKCAEVAVAALSVCCSFLFLLHLFSLSLFFLFFFH